MNTTAMDDLIACGDPKADADGSYVRLSAICKAWDEAQGDGDLFKNLARIYGDAFSMSVLKRYTLEEANTMAAWIIQAHVARETVVLQERIAELTMDLVKVGQIVDAALAGQAKEEGR